jgi:signal recognition particle receptor subunit beta
MNGSISVPVTAKIVVSGPFGVGKTTLVGTISEIVPLRTEAHMTSASVQIDNRQFLPSKTTTTVALDFGRVTIDETLRLYLFGTPGQERFGFMWDDLVQGALGAVVIADTRRLEDCYRAIDYYEARGMPFIVAINQFSDGPRHRLDQVRMALSVAESIPIIRFDARDRESVKDVLIKLLDSLLAKSRGATPPPTSHHGGPRLTAGG